MTKYELPAWMIWIGASLASVTGLGAGIKYLRSAILKINQIDTNATKIDTLETNTMERFDTMDENFITIETKVDEVLKVVINGNGDEDGRF